MKFLISFSLFLSSCLGFASDFDCHKIHLDQRTYHASLNINNDHKGSCHVSFKKEQVVPNFFFRPETSGTYKPIKSYSFLVDSLMSAENDSFADGLKKYTHAVLLQIETECYLAWYNEKDQLELSQVESLNSKTKSFILSGDAPSTSNPDEYKVESTWERISN
ncbi:MAG: hypothetical protein AB8G05_21220 [Oligoflexales bacterium]